MKGLLLSTVLVLSAGPACAEWMSFGESGAGTTVYADPTTKSRDGDQVNMWVLFDFKTAQAKADVSYLSAKAHMKYDCAKPRYEGLTVIYVSGNMGNGNILDRSSGKGMWLRISPGTLDHDLRKLACDTR